MRVIFYGGRGANKTKNMYEQAIMDLEAQIELLKSNIKSQEQTAKALLRKLVEIDSIIWKYKVSNNLGAKINFLDIIEEVEGILNGEAK